MSAEPVRIPLGQNTFNNQLIVAACEADGILVRVREITARST